MVCTATKFPVPMMRKKRRCRSAYVGKRHIKECPLRLDLGAIDDVPGQLAVVCASEALSPQA
jgi:hypothetical protein